MDKHDPERSGMPARARARTQGPGQMARRGRFGPTLAAVPTAVAAGLTAALMAGCFGGGGDDGEAGGPDVGAGASVPDSALGSSAAYTQFTLTTSQSSSETAEPLTADKVAVPPASETDEPVPVT